ncbi:MoaD/ThiS family protein [Staphylothermus hellenicus]|uniref:ThiamineS protein n=1 Tax=Staphylothermus hellenicus (strain DSM 12710 / JCM 10830 / BK20S6-10-b1 / P8) TaxID=591019 RepID=D7D814_STAHD|nr:MoaD/ThiS family protein [Staphylothermus hellenicus]ADI31910.1 thiamineS protein [Staphylothermus hellenicus DSM 12710]
MYVIVRLVDGSKEWKIEVPEGSTVRDVLAKIGLISNEYVIVRDGAVITEDDEVGDGDVLVLYPVVSGG